MQCEIAIETATWMEICIWNDVLHMWLFCGGDTCICSLPLTRFYKRYFAQVVVYAWFYKSEIVILYAATIYV